MTTRTTAGKRSKKRKSARGARAGRGKPARKPAELLSLSEVGRRTGISYPTLLRYVKLHLHEIPHAGQGRTRRYDPEAVEVFRGIRAQSTRGRRSTKMGAVGVAELRTLERRVAALERVQRRIEASLKELTRELRRPLRMTLKR